VRLPLELKDPSVGEHGGEGVGHVQVSRTLGSDEEQDRHAKRPVPCRVKVMVGETFTAPGTDIERLNYGFSVLHCLAVGMCDEPSAGTGTVMRLPTLRQYAREAGFRDVEVLPIEHDFWYLYRLTL
jgi:hypothetical protein